MINVIGVTFIARPSHTIEGAGSIYQSCLFAKIVSILFNHKYFHYPNLINPLGEVTSKDKIRSDWDQIFGFLSNQDKLTDFFHDELVVHYKFLSKYSHINHNLIANIDFQSSHSILKDNWSLYLERIYPHLLASFKHYNVFKPEHEYLDREKFNIVIHLRTHVKEDLPADQSMGWQNFNLNHGETFNTNYYSKLYSGLITKLIIHAKNNQTKPIAIHIFSRGDPDLFNGLQDAIQGADEINLHLNTKATDAFYSFLCADYLICAHSSFSWLASHLNPNPSFIRNPFRQILSPNGILFDDNLNFYNPRL
jgi:hypothetical protein